MKMLSVRLDDKEAAALNAVCEARGLSRSEAVKRAIVALAEAEPAERRALLDLARRSSLSIYDASYLEFAARHGWPIATRDRAVQRAAQQLGIALA